MRVRCLLISGVQTTSGEFEEHHAYIWTSQSTWAGPGLAVGTGRGFALEIGLLFSGVGGQSPATWLETQVWKSITHSSRPLEVGP